MIRAIRGGAIGQNGRGVVLGLGLLGLVLLALTGCTTIPEPENMPVPGENPERPPPETHRFADTLSICSGMTVSNAPRVEISGKIADFTPLIAISGLRLAVAPVPGACLSSGYGLRDGRLHKGLDYWAALGTPILAAGNGIVAEMTYRADYGNMILIDHGHGVYTRYAHLSAFGDDVEPGEAVRAGQVVGLMGNTSDQAIPVHLHYEILTGSYRTPKGSFGLTPVDPFGSNNGAINNDAVNNGD